MVTAPLNGRPPALPSGGCLCELPGRVLPGAAPGPFPVLESLFQRPLTLPRSPCSWGPPAQWLPTQVGYSRIAQAQPRCPVSTQPSSGLQGPADLRAPFCPAPLLREGAGGSEPAFRKAQSNPWLCSQSESQVLFNSLSQGGGAGREPPALPSKQGMSSEVLTLLRPPLGCSFCGPGQGRRG